MFERRLKLLLFVLAVPACLLVVRLIHLQMFAVEAARIQTEGLLYRDPQSYPFLRGSITDRNGIRLAYDAPSWDIGVHYGAMVRDREDLKEWASTLFPEEYLDDAIELITHRIDESWLVVSQLSGMTIPELETIRSRHVHRVMRIKEAVSRQQGVETPIREERWFHPIHRNLTQDEAVEARLTLNDYPWVSVNKSHMRRYKGGPAVGHLLGRLGEVSESARKNDPLIDDELAQYLLGDRHGVSGIERMAEQSLRGRRGQTHVDLSGKELSPPAEPVDGRDFRMTIDLVLQQTLYNQLAAAVERTPLRSGGCAVVLEIPTREVVAMVSYPAPDPDPAIEAKHRLSEQDYIRQRYLSRAIRGYYPPGSIVKPMILTGALSEGVIHEGQTLECHREFEAGGRIWHCTGAHGAVDPVYSIQHSCNIFYYQVGLKMGMPRLVAWMSKFGFGQRSGTGLPGEFKGRLPTSGDPCNMSIGQGALDITPIQAANMAATLASGEFRPVTVHADNTEPRPATRLPTAERYWRIVRQGMFEVVNTPGGTAYGPDRATLTDVDDYVLLGKTGSAQPSRRTLDFLFTCRFPDGQVKKIVARNKQELLADHPELAANPKESILGWNANRRWPEADPIPTHAWFIGYLAPRDRYQRAVPDSDLSVAIAVVIEYSGHGGDVAAPLARQMLKSVIFRHTGGRGGAS